MKVLSQILLSFLCLGAFAGTPIDLVEKPFSNEIYVVAIDVKVNPTNMPNMMLWDQPILLLYRQVENFDNIDVDSIRAQAVRDYTEGTYQPVVIRTRLGQSLDVHFMNLIGIGDAPERIVQGVVCKDCKNKKAYTFSYKEGVERSQYPWYASIHGHGINYTIENDGTRSGMNLADSPANDGLVAPGGRRTYHYRELDTPGVWPMHDHGNPSHTVPRGLHMALVVEDGKVQPDHDFLIIFSDFPDYDDYLDEFYNQTFIPAFIHMRNANVMHAHALNGYASMLPPRMRMAMNGGNSKWDAFRTDILPEPRTPVFETEMGDLVRFRLMSMGGAVTTHSFHLHGHVWWDRASGTYKDNVAVASGSYYDLMFYAGGHAYKPPPNFKAGEKRAPFVERSGTGDWLYHCHISPHVKHGMWGLFRVKEKAE